jgi:hypothetical protein
VVEFDLTEENINTPQETDPDNKDRGTTEASGDESTKAEPESPDDISRGSEPDKVQPPLTIPGPGEAEAVNAPRDGSQPNEPHGEPEGDRRHDQRPDRRGGRGYGGRRDGRPMTNEEKLRMYKKQSEERLLDIKRSREAKIGKKRK